MFEDWGQVKLNEPGSKDKKGKNSWQQVKHAWLHSDLLQPLNSRTFDRFRVSAEGTLISASGVHY